MNRKLLVNEQLEWPVLSASQNELLLKIIENFVKLHPSLKRKKLLAKKLRRKAVINDDKEMPATVNLMKNHFRIGINSVTRELEKDPLNVNFVIVCGSCKPILTRHLYIMSAQSNIKASSIKDLSPRLSKYFKVKTVSAFALCQIQKLDNETEIYRVLSELNSQVVECLPVLKKPFSICRDLKKVIQDEDSFEIEDTIEAVKIVKEVNVQETTATEAMVISEEDNETFGSDFISVKKTDTSEKWLPFSSKSKFIFFNDNYSDSNEADVSSDMQSSKRKLATRYNAGASSNYTLNPMGIRYRATDKNRQKAKKINKEKSLKNLEQNKFTKDCKNKRNLK